MTHDRLRPLQSLHRDPEDPYAITPTNQRRGVIKDGLPVRVPDIEQPGHGTVVVSYEGENGLRIVYRRTN